MLDLPFSFNDFAVESSPLDLLRKGVSRGLRAVNNGGKGVLHAGLARKRRDLGGRT